MDFDLFQSALDMFNGTFTAVKNAIGVLPDSKEKEKAEEALAKAEHEFDLAKANAADKLGYHLCKCTFPPQIMLEKPNNYARCPNCSKRVWLSTGEEIPRNTAVIDASSRPTTLAAIDEKVLLAVSQMSSTAQGVTARQIAAHFNLSQEKVTYILDKLTDKTLLQMLHTVYDTDSDTWRLTKYGRAYLVENEVIN